MPTARAEKLMSSHSSTDLHSLQSLHSLSHLPDAVKPRQQKRSSSFDAHTEHSAVSSSSSSSSPSSPSSNSAHAQPSWSIWHVTPIVRAVDSLFQTRHVLSADAHPLRAKQRKPTKRRTLLAAVNEPNVIRTADLLDPLQLLNILNEKRCEAVPHPLL